MTTTTATPPFGIETQSPERVAATPRVGPVIVATDGTTSADAAVRIGAEMAAHGSRVKVLTVLPPAPLVASDYGMLLPPIETEQARHEALVHRVEAQLRELLGPDCRWDVEVRGGDPAARIAGFVRETGASAVVVGLGHHDLLDRVFGGETALHALRQCRVPVIAVPPNAKALPTRVMVATDFSPASVRAAREALELFPGIAILYLVHVAPRMELQPEAYAAWMTEYSGGIEPVFNRIVAEIDAPARVTVETMTLTGKPARALLDFARSAHVDAIVTGSRGAGFIDRMLVGSTATRIIRGAHTMVIGVPASLGAPVTDTVVREGWGPLLDDFTRRNAGRDATLEVDDPDLGAQTVHRGYPFLGAAWDHHDQRVEMMMGEQDSTGHFTRGITDVRSVDILRDARGQDAVLRVSHGSGQTILTLVR